MEFFGFKLWVGEEGLKVYSEVHQHMGNVIVHTLFLPIITYSVLRWVYVLAKNRAMSRIVIMGMMMTYSNFYVLMGLVDMFLWFSLTIPLAILADRDFKVVNTKTRAFLCFLAPLLIQEIVGHALFEGVNSRLDVSHIANAVLYSPMFYTRSVYQLASFIFGSSFHPVGWVFGGTAVSSIGFYLSYLLLKPYLA